MKFNFIRHKFLYGFLVSVVHVIINPLVQSQIPIITYQAKITGLNAPVDIVNAGDGTNRLFIAQQGGTIKVYGPTYNFLGDFLTVTGIRTGGEEGLLSIAFHPDYETNRYFYVYYTNSAGNLQLARYQTRSDNPNLADANSKDTVLTISHPTFNNHNGGKLLFGPDNYLYFATGDGGNGGDPPNNAQNGMVLLGKMLRINVTTDETGPFYTIPADNPYVSNPNVADEIWALGLRNPFRWSFDRLTDDMWIGDVGQGAREEINFRPAAATAGVNYGWRCYEGNLPYNTTGCAAPSSYVFPVYDYLNPPEPNVSTAITGGIVYRGTAYPSMVGYYFATDFYLDSLFLIKPNGSGGWTTTVQSSGVENGIAGFGESENGELYAVSLFTGTAYQLISSSVVPVTLTSFTGLLKNGTIELNWQTATQDNVNHYEIEYGGDGINFVKTGEVAATKAGSYRFIHNISGGKKYYYRLRIVDNDGKWEYSKIILVSIDNNADKNFVRPSVITNNRLQLDLSNSYSTLKLMNLKGSVVYKRSITDRTGRFSLQIPALPAGNYLVTIEGPGNTTISQKILIR